MLHVTLCADQLVWVGHSALLTGLVVWSNFLPDPSLSGSPATSEPGVAAVVAALLCAFQPSPGVRQTSCWCCPGAHKWSLLPESSSAAPGTFCIPSVTVPNTHEVLPLAFVFPPSKYWRVICPCPKDGEATRLRGRSDPRGTLQAGSEKRLQGE